MSRSVKAPRDRRIGRAIGTVAWYAGAFLIAATTVTPLLWTLATSLKPAGEILANSLSLIPSSPTFDNYVEVFTTVPFGRYILNSTILAIGGVITNVLLGALAGYALAKLVFPGRKAVYATFLASLMIPGVAILIPSFLIMRFFPFAGGNNILGQGGTGFVNTYAAVLVPYAVGAFAVFYMKQFFESLPGDLAEAARVDGAGEFKIFARIYLPLAKPAMAVLGILTFQAGWNSFLWPLIVLNKPEMLTVQVGLAGFVNNYSTNYGPLMAGTILTAVPVLVVFLFAQKWIIQGVANTGIKG